MRTYQHTRKPIRSFETLESRDTPAGLVAAAIIEGRLTITGDAGANQVFLGRNDAGDWFVRGVSGASGAPTLINGAASWTAPADWSGIDVHLAAGDDMFYMGPDAEFKNGVPFSQNHWRAGSFGPLSEQSGIAIIRGNLTLNLGEGNDTGVIAASSADGIAITGGDGEGDDGIFVRTNTTFGTSSTVITSRVIVALGGGNDYAALSLRNVSNQIILNGDAGNDTWRIMAPDAAEISLLDLSGDNSIELEGLRRGGYGLTLLDQAPQLTNAVSMITGSGNDEISAERLDCGVLSIDSGGGLDDIAIRGVDITHSVLVRGGGMIGSSIEIGTRTDSSLGEAIDNYVGTAYLQAFDFFETYIGGDVNISFTNMREPPVKEPGASMSVSLLGNRDSYWNAQSKSSVRIGGTLSVFGTVGDDDLKVIEVDAAGLVLDAGAGADFIRVEGVEIAGDASVRLGDGDDIGCIVSDGYSTAELNSSDPNATTAVPTWIHGSLLVDFGGGEELDPSIYPRDPGLIAGRLARSSQPLIEKLDRSTNRLAGSNRLDYEGPNAFGTPATGFSFYPFHGVINAFAIGAGRSGRVDRMRVDGPVKINAGEGSATFSVFAAQFGSLEVSLTGASDSAVDMTVLDIRGDLNFYGGSGTNQTTLNAVNIGEDLLLYGSGSADSFFVNDRLQLPTFVRGTASVLLLHGDDSFQLGEGAAFSCGTFSLNAGGGNDAVSLANLAARDHLFANLLDGDDSLSLEECSGDNAGFDGGPGRNELRGFDRKKFKTAGRIGFEIVLP